MQTMQKACSKYLLFFEGTTGFVSKSQCQIQPYLRRKKIFGQVFVVFSFSLLIRAIKY